MTVSAHVAPDENSLVSAAGFDRVSRPRLGTLDILPPDLDSTFVSLFERALPRLCTRANDSHARISAST